MSHGKASKDCLKFDLLFVEKRFWGLQELADRTATLLNESCDEERMSPSNVSLLIGKSSLVLSL